MTEMSIKRVGIFLTLRTRAGLRAGERILEGRARKSLMQAALHPRTRAK